MNSIENKPKVNEGAIVWTLVAFAVCGFIMGFLTACMIGKVF